MICKKCKKEFEEKEIHEHHNPPKFMFGLGENWQGELIYLCEKHHNILHQLIATWIWFYVNDYKICSWKTKINCRNSIFNQTKKWMVNEDDSISEI